MTYSIFNPQLKDNNERDKKYLEFVTTKPCIAPGCIVSNWGGSDVGLIAYHHVRELLGGGMALKPPDYHTVPLCDCHHKLWHQSGMSSLNLDIEYVMNCIIKQLIEYVTILKT